MCYVNVICLIVLLLDFALSQNLNYKSFIESDFFLSNQACLIENNKYYSMYDGSNLDRVLYLVNHHFGYMLHNCLTRRGNSCMKAILFKVFFSFNNDQQSIPSYFRPIICLIDCVYYQT